MLTPAELNLFLRWKSYEDNGGTLSFGYWVTIESMR